MSEKTKKILAAIGIIILIIGVLWIVWDLITALIICAIYFAGWLYNPLRFWKVLGVIGSTILGWIGLGKRG